MKDDHQNQLNNEKSEFYRINLESKINDLH